MKLDRPSSVRDDLNPGLSALVVYFRPVDREKVLRTLVSAGVFTREIDHSGGSAPWRRIGHADFAVVFPSCDAEHKSAVDLYSELSNATLVVLPEECDCELKDWSGDEVHRSSRDVPLARDAVVRIAQVSRRRAEGRLMPKQRTPCVIFGGVVFQPGQPLLQRGKLVEGLSPTEFGVLQALVSANGSIVTKSVLQLELTGGSDVASDGYLKTVVLRIRRKVERLGGDASHLAAIRGAGYVLRA